MGPESILMLVVKVDIVNFVEKKPVSRHTFLIINIAVAV